MDSIEKIQQKSKEKQVWAGMDPVTLVSAAREGLYDLTPEQRQTLEGPIEEVLNRFDQQTRAALGHSQFVGTQPSAIER